MPLKQNEVYKLVYEIVTEALIVADVHGVIIDANPAAVSLFKYPMETLIRLNVDELLPDALQKGHAKHREGFSKKPEKRVMGSGMELSAKDAHGNLIPVEVSLNHSKKDGVFRVVALITDITNRKEAEQRMLQLNKELEKGVEQRTTELNQAVKALEESQHLYTLIAQNFPDGTINVLNSKLEYIFAEGKEFARSGIDRNKVIGLNYISLLPKDYQEHVSSELKKVLEGIPRTFEIVSKNNTFIMTAVPLYDDERGIDRLLLVEKNISEQKQAEQDMIHALNKERELNELKSRFVSMASHEFRTPLATVLSSVNLVSRHAEVNNREGIEKHVGRIRSAIRNLTSILNDFLSLEKLEQGKVQFKPSPFNVCDLAETIVEEIDGLTKKNQTVHLSLQPDRSDDVCVINGLDPQLLRNILFNLLSNAVKYSSEGAPINLELKLSDTLIITVCDNGIGIPKDEQQHLFERFFRAKNATNIQGTGLGLNIVKKHVELMGGQITFDSVLGKGTSFVISLPIEPSN